MCEHLCIVESLPNDTERQAVTLSQEATIFGWGRHSQGLLNGCRSSKQESMEEQGQPWLNILPRQKLEVYSRLQASKHPYPTSTPNSEEQNGTVLRRDALQACFLPSSFLCDNVFFFWAELSTRVTKGMQSGSFRTLTSFMVTKSLEGSCYTKALV